MSASKAIISAGAFLAATAATAAAPVPGDYAVRSAGKAILELKLSAPAQPQGDWNAVLVHPEHLQFTGSDAVVFTKVAGPAKSERLTGHETVNGLQLNSGDRTHPQTWAWQQTSPQSGKLTLAGMPFSLTFTAARDGETVSDQWDSSQSYRSDSVFDSNPEMASIYQADQAARSAANIDWSVVGPADEKRRARTRQLLDSGLLHTADDFYNAAFVFQHGGEPDDFLIAHTLAMIATSKGHPEAIWIAAATLDRYLQRSGHPQIYGTQYTTTAPTIDGKPDVSKMVTTQEPYDKTLIPDALREALQVPTLQEQEVRRQGIDQQMREQLPPDPNLSGPAKH